MPTPKPSSLVGRDVPIEISSDEHRWVSRGSYKLLAALEAFGIDVRSRKALDVGASTGGFTEVLLHAGSSSVLALDVGRGQLHERLRGDPRVTSMERTNFRYVDPDSLGGRFDVVVADLSFISLCTVATQLAAAGADDADFVMLIKPQFEATRSSVGRGGVVRSQKVRYGAITRVVNCMVAAGINPLGLIESPLTGSDGNIEYLLWGRTDTPAVDVEVMI